MAWKLDKVEHVIGGGNGGGGVPVEVTNHVNNTAIHVTQALKDKINQSITSKDICIQMAAPFTMGAQKDTEFYFPYTGTLSKININLSEASAPQSNLLIAVQEFKNNAWVGLYTANVGISTKVTSYDTDLALDNSIIRIVLLAGDFVNVDLVNIILNVTDII